MRQGRTLLILTAAIGLVVGTAGSASAARAWYVNNGTASCSDAGTGTQSAPFCTIGAAAAKAAAGDTVQVAAGTYAEAVTVRNSGTAAAPIVYQASPGATVKGGAIGFKMSGKSYVTIRGFTVMNTTGVGIQVSASNHVTLDHNTVSFAGQPVNGLTAKGISLSGTISSVVSGNVTHHNSDAGIGLSSSSNGNTISGNESYSNARAYTRAAAG